MRWFRISEHDSSSRKRQAVGGVHRDEVPLIVTDLIDGMDADLEILVRPERVGSRYTIEWETVEQGGTPRQDESRSWNSLPNRWRVIKRRCGQVLTTIRAKIGGIVPTFDVDPTRINLFEVDDHYLFKHYFEQDDLFAALRSYYNGDEYRFEVPEDALDEVRETLEAHYFEPVIIEHLEPFCVVQKRYSEHPDVLFKASVLERTQGEYHIFLMKDQLSVEQAVNSGAKKLVDSDATLPI